MFLISVNVFSVEFQEIVSRCCSSSSRGVVRMRLAVLEIQEINKFPIENQWFSMFQEPREAETFDYPRDF